jgi:hypothetical protein
MRGHLSVRSQASLLEQRRWSQKQTDNDSLLLERRCAMMAGSNTEHSVRDGRAGATHARAKECMERVMWWIWPVGDAEEIQLEGGST